MSEEKSKKKEKILGIDLGTSNSAAAIMMGGKAEIIPAAEGVSVGGKAFPSYIAFLDDGKRIVGEPARRQAASNPERTVTKIKRKMGTSEKIKIDGKEYTPEELSAMILSKIKKDAEDYIGEEIKKVVITVPAFFNNAERQATKDAGKIAGFEVERIINEPTAACLAYGLDKQHVDSENIVVLDLGGGTFDVTIMEHGEGVFEVLSTSGDTKCGGTDMDMIIQDWIVSEFKRKEDVDISKDPQAMMRVLEASEKAKIELSSTFSAVINLPFISMGKNNQPVSLDLELTRSKMEELVDPVLSKLETPMRKALEDSGLRPNEIARIIMVGGPSRMPIVQQAYEKFFKRKPEKSVDPMECVAKGAAIQGGALSGEVEDLLLLDVTPLTLSIETLGGVSTPLIERNTTIPVEKSKVFSTAADNQPSVEINILQGERPMAAQNVTLGKFHLDGIPPAPRGTPQIEVSFSLDANGILVVTAKDKGTGKDASIRIDDSSNLTEDEIRKKMDDAKSHEKEDKKLQELIQARNELSGMAFQAEKLLKDNEEVLKDEGDLKKQIQDGIIEAKKLETSEDLDAIKEAKEALEQPLHKIAEKIYAQQGGPGGPGGMPGGMGGMPGGMGGMDPAQAAEFMKQQQAQQGQTSGASSSGQSSKKDDKKKVVDVDWEDEE